jgi:hypothetical protein
MFSKASASGSASIGGSSIWLSTWKITALIGMLSA